MEGMQVDTLRMDPFWNQYWQESMMINAVQQQQDTLARQQAYLAQQAGNGTNVADTTNVAFQANPNGASATTNIQSMQEEAPKKGKGWKRAGIITAIGATALLFFANSKGGGNIAEGLKKIWSGTKYKADGLFRKTKTINDVNLVKQEGKFNRIKSLKGLEALGVKGTIDVNGANTTIQRFTCNIDDVLVTVKNGKVIKAVGQDGKAIEKISDDLLEKANGFIKMVNTRDAEALSKLTDIQYVQTENGIRSVFNATKHGDTPVFSHGVSKWFPEQPVPSVA